MYAASSGSSMSSVFTYIPGLNTRSSSDWSRLRWAGSTFRSKPLGFFYSILCGLHRFRHIPDMEMEKIGEQQECQSRQASSSGHSRSPVLGGFTESVVNNVFPSGYRNGPIMLILCGGGQLCHAEVWFLDTVRNMADSLLFSERSGRGSPLPRLFCWPPVYLIVVIMYFIDGNMNPHRSSFSAVS